MRHSSFNFRTILTVVGFLLFSHGQSFAQTPPTPNFSPPTVDMQDVVGVAMNSGRPNFSMSPVKIGPASDPFSFSESFAAGMNYPTAGFFGIVSGSTLGSPYGVGDMIVNVLGKGEQLKPVGDGVNYVSRNAGGGTLSISAAFAYQYIDRAGTIYNFTQGQDPKVCTDQSVVSGSPPAIYEWKASSLNCAVLSSVNYPNGVVLSIGPYLSVPGDSTRVIQKITRSDGFQFVVDWGVSNFPMLPAPRGAVYYLNKVTAYNMAMDYCDSAAISCTFSQSWPIATMTRTASASKPGDVMTFTLTGNAGNVTRYTEKFMLGVTADSFGAVWVYQLLTGLKPASSPTLDTRTYNYANQSFCWSFWSTTGYPPTWQTDCTIYQRDELVQSVVTPQGNWTYAYIHPNPAAPIQSMAPGNYITTVTRPDSYTMSGEFNALTGYIGYVSGTQGQVNYDTVWMTEPNFLQSSTDSEGRGYGYGFDSRGNLQSKSQTGSSTGPVWRAVYPPTCTNAVTCNKPTQLIDPNGNTTDYVYDSTHGGVLTESKPADANGIRPQTRYGYTQRTPWLKNAGGGYSAGAPIWKLTSESYCRSSASPVTGGCTVAGDEVVTTYDYGANAGPSNLLLHGVAVTADGTTHRTCYTYDIYGNKISETPPNAGLTSCP
jgi:YD repeat-containing protein